MRPLILLPATLARYPPLAATPVRAVAEGLAGCTLVYGVAALLRSAHAPVALMTLPVVLGGTWLTLWPALRLRRVAGGRWPLRLLSGAGRALALGLVLALLGGVLATILRLTPAGLRAGAPAVVSFPLMRLMVLVGATLARPIRRRLRWQLTASHLAILLLTFALLTAPASALAVSFIVANVVPHPDGLARSLAETLHPQANGTVDLAGAQTLFTNMQEGRVVLRAWLPASLIALGTRSGPALGLALLEPNGRMLVAAAGAVTLDGSPTLRSTPLPSALLHRVRQAALAGRTLTVPLPWTLRGNRELLGVAPVRAAGGRVVAVVLVQSLTLDLGGAQFLAFTLALFGVSTLTLTLATLVLTLGLSALFGYALAHGLTRRLEALSSAATAIAQGDLSRRVPVKAQNEVGRLAASFNQMAAHLETTMDEVQRARTQAVDALRARRELVASISHELRTPLAVVRAHLDTLLMNHPTGEGGEPELDAQASREVTVPVATLRALNHEMERLASLVDDLFALSRAETGVVHVHAAPTDVGALVTEVAALMRPLAQAEGKIALSVDISPRLPPASADGDRLRQILANLVRNAVRHTPEGGIIALSATVEAPWVVVTVADTGEGIPPESLPHIFERFYRVDQARSRTSGGAGLGLAIVREFVELMGGRVTVESTLGEGSCFRVFLPHAA